MEGNGSRADAHQVRHVCSAQKEIQARKWWICVIVFTRHKQFWSVEGSNTVPASAPSAICTSHPSAHQKVKHSWGASPALT
eukprot:1157514-Pelagomonas_calceolata.AAC.12